eukprot:m.254906 g.254906  ORF g.254906 m.254906 type:complete len:339 (+) comp19607_c0_seq14:46-1062(+)
MIRRGRSIQQASQILAAVRTGASHSVVAIAARQETSASRRRTHTTSFENTTTQNTSLLKLNKARSQIHSVLPVADAKIEVVGQWTDIEGNFDYFCNLVNRSRVVNWSDGVGSALELLPGAGLIFGGDCFDKGAGDIRISSLLVDLKQRHPDRVALLLGNRDVNKMRFASELHPSDLARPLTDLPAPYYMGEHGREPSEYLPAMGWDDTSVNRLRYMLRHTMGSPDAFELRRLELALLHACTDIRDVSDTMVLDSFVCAVQEDGIYRRYLEHAQVAAVVGNTLFVHGAVSPKSLGFVPCPARTRHKLNAEHEIYAHVDGVCVYAYACVRVCVRAPSVAQ